MIENKERFLYLINLQEKYKSLYFKGDNNDRLANSNFFPSIWYQIESDEIKIGFLEEALKSSKKLEDLESFRDYQMSFYDDMLAKNILITKEKSKI